MRLLGDNTSLSDDALVQVLKRGTSATIDDAIAVTEFTRRFAPQVAQIILRVNRSWITPEALTAATAKALDLVVAKIQQEPDLSGTQLESEVEQAARGVANSLHRTRN
jgi:hypothetical protein